MRPSLKIGVKAGQLKFDIVLKNEESGVVLILFLLYKNDKNYWRKQNIVYNKNIENKNN